ncbi:hypothetical protein JAAARDRAFT_34898 [Jaapia argillacea MUCL 33604]|uniref:Uncharacterized protein n=1 Tax=Jaapia argillacea MUCL 33604 TaxID=933084 RepID=A0A067Q3N9_9AGAM|nr:hypothetical protein JAAARDRAFT_34898 [Jaapia argillacea MUCL 33604]
MAATSTTTARPRTRTRDPPNNGNRDSNLVRASVLDAALQLGVGSNWTVTNWMFDNGIAEEEEEEPTTSSNVPSGSNTSQFDDPLPPQTRYLSTSQSGTSGYNYRLPTKPANSPYPYSSASSASDLHSSSRLDLESQIDFNPKRGFHFDVGADFPPPPTTAPAVDPHTVTPKKSMNKLRKLKQGDVDDGNGNYFSDAFGRGKKPERRADPFGGYPSDVAKVGKPGGKKDLSRMFGEASYEEPVQKGPGKKDLSKMFGDDVDDPSSAFDTSPRTPSKKDKKKSKKSPANGDDSDGGYLSESSTKRKKGFFRSLGSSGKRNRKDSKAPAPVPPMPVMPIIPMELPHLPPSQSLNLPIAEMFARSETPPPDSFSSTGMADIGRDETPMGSSYDLGYGPSRGGGDWKLWDDDGGAPTGPIIPHSLRKVYEAQSDDEQGSVSLNRTRSIESNDQGNGSFMTHSSGSIVPPQSQSGRSGVRQQPSDSSSELSHANSNVSGDSNGVGMRESTARSMAGSDGSDTPPSDDMTDIPETVGNWTLKLKKKHSDQVLPTISLPITRPEEPIQSSPDEAYPPASRAPFFSRRGPPNGLSLQPPDNPYRGNLRSPGGLSSGGYSPGAPSPGSSSGYGSEFVSITPSTSMPPTPVLNNTNAKPQHKNFLSAAFHRSRVRSAAPAPSSPLPLPPPATSSQGSSGSDPSIVPSTDYLVPSPIPSPRAGVYDLPPSTPPPSGPLPPPPMGSLPPDGFPRSPSLYPNALARNGSGGSSRPSTGSRPGTADREREPEPEREWKFKLKPGPPSAYRDIPAAADASSNLQAAPPPVSSRSPSPGLYNQQIPRVQRGRESPFPARPILPPEESSQLVRKSSLAGRSGSAMGRYGKDVLRETPSPPQSDIDPGYDEEFGYGVGDGMNRRGSDKRRGMRYNSVQSEDLGSPHHWPPVPSSSMMEMRKPEPVVQPDVTYEDDNDLDFGDALMRASDRTRQAPDPYYAESFYDDGDDDEEAEGSNPDLDSVLSRFQDGSDDYEDTALSESASKALLFNHHHHHYPREETADDDDASRYPEDDKTAGRRTMYELEGLEDEAGYNRQSVWTVGDRGSILDGEKSWETRDRFVQRVEAMYGEDGREMPAIPPVPRMNPRFANMVGAPNGAGRAPRFG